MHFARNTAPQSDGDEKEDLDTAEPRHGRLARGSTSSTPLPLPPIRVVSPRRARQLGKQPLPSLSGLTSLTRLALFWNKVCLRALRV